MSPEENEREKLEKEIIACGNELKWDKNIGCFDKARVFALIHAWGLLVGHYKWQAMNHPAREDDDGQPINNTGLDLSISVEVVREYLYWTNRFAATPIEPESRDCAELRREVLASLDGAIHDIIGAVEECIYPTGR